MPEKNLQHLVINAGYLIAGILIIAVTVVFLQNLLGFVKISSTPSGWQIIRPPQEVSTLIIENEWVWTGGKDGLILINRSTGTRINPAEPAPSFGYVRQILRDSRGGIWVGHDNGLACYRNGSWQVIAPSPEVPFLRVLSIAEFPHNAMVIGTDTDVLVFKEGSWRSLLGNNSPSIASADVLFVDRDNTLWIGCGSPTHGGLYSLNGTSWSVFSEKDGLPHPSVRAITQTRDGAVWVATGFSRHGGAARYFAGSITNLTKNDGLAGESTRSVYQDTRGRMWIGSEYDGITVLVNGTEKILTEKEGLAGNEVKIMLQDRDGNYWFGTNKGLSRSNGTVL
jgi:ligand-binding sensor domain-containing protein